MCLLIDISMCLFLVAALEIVINLKQSRLNYYQLNVRIQPLPPLCYYCHTNCIFIDCKLINTAFLIVALCSGLLNKKGKRKGLQTKIYLFCLLLFYMHL